MYSYKTSGVCARTINFDIDDNGIITAVEFDGRLQWKSNRHLALGSGEAAEEIISILKGTTCGKRPTSCPDQLAPCTSRSDRRTLDDRLDPQSIT